MGEIEQWFSYSEDAGFRRHSSADEARACAASALDDDTDASGDGWPEGTGNTCWGEVREAAVETITHEHGPDCRPVDEDDDDVHDCTDDFDLRFDYISRFDLTPTTRACDRAEAIARAEAAERELAQLRADRAVLASALVPSWPAELNSEVLPANPEPVLSMIRAGALAAIKTPNHAGIETYLREMFKRIEAEATTKEVSR